MSDREIQDRISKMRRAGDMTAVVYTDDNGNTVFDDPVALGVAKAIAFQHTLEINKDRVKHFIERIEALGHTPTSHTIIIINVDDDNGAALADLLMPGHDWDSIRAQGQVPFARGLVNKEALIYVLRTLDKEVARTLSVAKETAVIIIDMGGAAFFYAKDCTQ